VFPPWILPWIVPAPLVEQGRIMPP